MREPIFSHRLKHQRPKNRLPHVGIETPKLDLVPTPRMNIAQLDKHTHRILMADTRSIGVVIAAIIARETLASKAMNPGRPIRPGAKYRQKTAIFRLFCDQCCIGLRGIHSTPLLDQHQGSTAVTRVPTCANDDEQLQAHMKPQPISPLRPTEQLFIDPKKHVEAVKNQAWPITGWHHHPVPIGGLKGRRLLKPFPILGFAENGLRQCTDIILYY